MGNTVPALGLLIDIIFGFLMWAAILRFTLMIFMREDSRFLPMRLTASIIRPILRGTKFITPIWVIDRIQPLYAAFLLFLIRFYLIPLIIGYDVPSFASLPLEDLILSVKADLGF